MLLRQGKVGERISYHPLICCLVLKSIDYVVPALNAFSTWWFGHMCAMLHYHHLILASTSALIFAKRVGNGAFGACTEEQGHYQRYSPTHHLILPRKLSRTSVAILSIKFVTKSAPIQIMVIKAIITPTMVMKALGIRFLLQL